MTNEEREQAMRQIEERMEELRAERYRLDRDLYEGLISNSVFSERLERINRQVRMLHNIYEDYRELVQDGKTINEESETPEVAFPSGTQFFPYATRIKEQDGLKRRIIDLCLEAPAPDRPNRRADFLYCLQGILDAAGVDTPENGAKKLVRSLGNRANKYVIKDVGGTWYIEHAQLGSGEPLAQWAARELNR